MNRSVHKPVMYIGDGAYLIGVPACDMTLEEWERLPQAVRTLGVQLHLYQVGTVKRAVGWNDKHPSANEKES